MQIIEFSGNTLRFLEQSPPAVPDKGFVWIHLERNELQAQLPSLQDAALRLGGSTLLDLHVKDLHNAAHPSRYDFTSVYDLMIFRRLATDIEVQAELDGAEPSATALAAFGRIRTLAVGFVVFDRLLVTVHPAGCYTAKLFVQRYLSDAVQSEAMPGGARSRLPGSPADLMLRMLNLMVDSYLDLRRTLTSGLDEWQQHLLAPRAGRADWGAVLTARNALHTLEDLCEEQKDAMQEWLDAMRVQPLAFSQAEQDSLMARARDVAEHIDRVVHHVRRMGQGAETAVQIYFSVVGNRTNDIMRTLTALTAIFLPLNLIAGIFGMNFEFIPLLHSGAGFWWTMGSMLLIACTLGVVFWRKHYLARSGR